ncbi:hypothetical protein PM3016_6615 [Paenibacillus mucilaginosus 3016]|uniref:Uncharacterized protein n=3 Tax=Paenibacillus mucilaginosus TaxID=61624 RepID=H6NM68_9BACL|nr:hypothetical protein PM3016_6615 [Paenibacillus mucilaginosus 3016]
MGKRGAAPANMVYWKRISTMGKSKVNFMKDSLIWLAFAAVCLVLYIVNRIYRRTGRLGQATRELRRLTGRVREGQASAGDLGEWDRWLPQLESYPSDYNQLNQDIDFTGAFTAFLQQYYPQDPRLPALAEAARHKKDTIWGIKIPGDKR